MTILHQQRNGFVNIYDFGNAHGRTVYTKAEDFIAAIRKIVGQYPKGTLFMGVTIPGQNNETKWLNEAGFTGTKITDRHTQWHAFTEDVFSEETVKKTEEAKRAHEAALAARPRNADGRLLRVDGKVIRRPYEYFVGDRIRFQAYEITKEKTSWGDVLRAWSDWKEETVREVEGAGYNTTLKLRTREINPAHTHLFTVELLERAQ